jgi:hypothetical protein
LGQKLGSLFFPALVTLSMFVTVACNSGDQETLVNTTDGIIGKETAPDFADKNNPVHSMVFLGEDKGPGISLCGGLVVGRRSILTARHCAKTADTEILVSFPKGNEPIENKASVFSRSTKRIKVLDRVYPSKISFDGTKIFEYSERGVGRGFRLDVAILHLEEDVPVSVPVFDLTKIATGEDLKTGKLVAYGYDTEASLEVGIMKGYNINLLRAVDRKVTPKSLADIKELKELALIDVCLGDDRTVDCRNGLSKKVYGTSLEDLKLTVALDGGMCEGDSGSPLFVLTANQEYKLVGVTSEAFAAKAWIKVRSTSCAHLGAYQNINPLRLWLNEVIK